MLLDKIKKSWNESHHNLHFKYGILVGLVLTIFGGIGCAFGMEYKDQRYYNNHNNIGIGSKFSWADFWYTVAGAFVGQLIQLLIIFAFIKIF